MEQKELAAIRDMHGSAAKTGEAPRCSWCGSQAPCHVKIVFSALDRQYAENERIRKVIVEAIEVLEGGQL